MPVTLISRRVTTNTILVDGMQIPKGVGVSCNVYLNYWQDGKVEHGGMDLMTGFRPERWLDLAGAVVLSWGSPGHDGAIHVPFAPGEGGSSGNGRRPSVPIDYQINWNELSAVATPQDGVPNSNCKGAEMQK